MTNPNRQNRGLGIVFIIIGALFLFLQFANVNISWFAWPFFVILPGVLLLTTAFLSGKTAAGLAIPGSIVTMIGLILFLQNVTGRFETWSYVWALILTAVGIGIFIQGMLTQDDKLRTDGSRLAMMGVVMLLFFGAFFELFIFNHFANSFLWRYALPMFLIGLGACLTLWRRNERKEPDDISQT